MHGRMVTATMLLLAGLAAGACRPGERRQEGGPMPRRDIQVVQEENIPALMARPGAVGVAIGAMPDGTPCIVVYVAAAADSARAGWPTMLEGHPVRIEVSGIIRPLGQ